MTAIGTNLPVARPLPVCGGCRHSHVLAAKKRSWPTAIFRKHLGCPGMTSIERFLRPVCYQGFPDTLLSETLREANPWRVPRIVGGQLAL